MQSIFLSQEQVKALFDRESICFNDDRHRQSSATYNQPPDFGQKNFSTFGYVGSSEIRKFQSPPDDEDQRLTDKQIAVIPIDEYDKLKLMEKENIGLRQELKTMLERIKAQDTNYDEMREMKLKSMKDQDQLSFFSDQNSRLKNHVKDLLDKQKRLIDESTNYHSLYLQTQVKLRENQSKLNGQIMDNRKSKVKLEPYVGDSDHKHQDSEGSRSIRPQGHGDLQNNDDVPETSIKRSSLKSSTQEGTKINLVTLVGNLSPGSDVKRLDKQAQMIRSKGQVGQPVFKQLSKNYSIDNISHFSRLVKGANRESNESNK